MLLRFLDFLSGYVIIAPIYSSQQVCIDNKAMSMTKAVLGAFLLSLSVVEAQPQYTIIIDAGSSGSRVRMFNVSQSSVSQIVPTDADEDSFETEPGLSDYASNPSGAGPSLSGILNAATSYIPSSAQASTPVFVKATAGMRLLEPSVVNAIFESVQQLLESDDFPFAFGSAMVISGEEEALFGFVAVNSYLGTLYGESLGAMDLGGASTQVAFQPENMIRDGKFMNYMGDTRMSAYTKSYMRFGQSEALLRSEERLVRSVNATTITHPCLHTGYSEEVTIGGVTYNFTGGSDGAACDTLVRSLLQLDVECVMTPCAIFGNYMPAIGTTQFRAFSAFFFAVNGMGLVGWNGEMTISRKTIYDTAMSHCALNQTAASAVSGSSVRYSRIYCFAGLYTANIMMAYGFGEDDMRVTFSRKIAGNTLDWALGAAMYEMHMMPMRFMDKCARATTTCGDLRSHYRSNQCCGSPTKVIPYPSQ